MAKCIICREMVVPYEEGKMKEGYLCPKCLAELLGKKGSNLSTMALSKDKLDNLRKLSSQELMSMHNDRQQEIMDQKAAIEEEQIKQKQEISRAVEKAKTVLVTTCDIKQEYDIVCPVYIQINNRGNQFRELREKYNNYISSQKDAGQMSGDYTTGWEIFETLFVSSAATVAHSSFDEAFFIAVEELKERAALLKADAVVGMRYDLDLDTNGLQYFYLQMYGTAVRFK